MVKKLDEMGDKQAASPGMFDSTLASQVKDSAQQIWLAGMGAFSKAQAEGKQVFETLVKEGVSLQKKTQTAAEERMGEVSSKVSSMAGDVSTRAGQQWDKLETIFEERTAKALKRLGVPSAKDVEALNARIEELSAELARSAKKPAPTRAAPSKPAATKSAVPRSAASKTAPAKTAATKTAARKSTGTASRTTGARGTGRKPT